VVGPLHKGGNVGILTFDFVHRSHIDIFGYYYPRVFTDWWADTWMTRVYGAERTLKLPGVRVVHTLEVGQRYKVQFSKEKYLRDQLEEDKITLNRCVWGTVDLKMVLGNNRYPVTIFSDKVLSSVVVSD